jgi:hypothetical protein
LADPDICVLGSAKPEAFPGTDVGVGLGERHRSSERSEAGGGANFGSPADRPSPTWRGVTPRWKIAAHPNPGAVVLLAGRTAISVRSVKPRLSPAIAVRPASVNGTGPEEEVGRSAGTLFFLN